MPTRPKQPPAVSAVPRIRRHENQTRVSNTATGTNRRLVVRHGHSSQIAAQGGRLGVGAQGGYHHARAVANVGGGRRALETGSQDPGPNVGATARIDAALTRSHGTRRHGMGAQGTCRQGRTRRLKDVAASGGLVSPDALNNNTNDAISSICVGLGAPSDTSSSAGSSSSSINGLGFSLPPLSGSSRLSLGGGGQENSNSNVVMPVKSCSIFFKAAFGLMKSCQCG
jgi:hypothetical protein